MGVGGGGLHGPECPPPPARPGPAAVCIDVEWKIAVEKGKIYSVPSFNFDQRSVSRD